VGLGVGLAGLSSQTAALKGRAMRSAKLNALMVQRAKKPGLLGDGLGLYLQVGPNGAKSWLLRYKRGGKSHYCGLGPVHTVSLAQARQRAADARLLLLEGRDPIAAKRASRAAAAAAKTFRETAEDYIAAHRAGWRSAKHAAQWPASLANYVYPVIGEIDVARVDTPDILRVLRPIWAEKPETASRIRSRLELILDAAKAAGLRGDCPNPARWKGHLQSLFPAARKVGRVVHFAAMPYAQVPGFVRELRNQNGVAPLALQFVILTAARSGEALGARWSEIDLGEKVWTVPGERMKVGREHRVPLSDPALAILSEMMAVREDAFVFPGLRQDRHLTAGAIQDVLMRMGRRDATVHGFRSSFRDWAGNETSFPREVCEQALAHTVGDQTEAAYRRSDALERRRRLMEAWAAHCLDQPAGSNVVSMAGR